MHPLIGNSSIASKNLRPDVVMEGTRLAGMHGLDSSDQCKVKPNIDWSPDRFSERSPAARIQVALAKAL